MIRCHPAQLPDKVRVRCFCQALDQMLLSRGMPAGHESQQPLELQERVVVAKSGGFTDQMPQTNNRLPARVSRLG